MKKPVSKPKAAKKPTVSGQVQDIAIDGVHGAFVHAGTVRMNFYVNAFDPACDDVSRVVTHRVVMPLMDFVSFADTLVKLKSEIAKVGAEQAEALRKPKN
ncbi:MAG: hypothetical protein H6878_00085 [Rhodobiaceae bacterium]|nr:hypothetical protein [Rhodobiaceae bacterium]MCC0053810.1 hypothetical protein [Rhodobiaceae bacterium]